MNARIVFSSLIALTILISGAIGVSSAPPAWSASGDSFVANIVFPSLAEQVKKAPVKDGKIESVHLIRKDEKSISAGINLELLKPELKGTVCSINTVLFIESMTINSGTIKLKDTSVEACNSPNKLIPNAIIVQAANVAVSVMKSQIEKDMNKSINNTLQSTIRQLRQQGRSDVKLAYEVFAEGLSIFVYSGEKVKSTKYTRVPYELTHKNDCNDIKSAMAFHSYDTDSKYEGSVKVIVKNPAGSSTTDIFSAAMKETGKEGEDSSGTIMPGKSHEFTKSLSAWSGKNVTVEFHTGAGSLLGGLAPACGKIQFDVPTNGDLVVEVEKRP